MRLIKQLALAKFSIKRKKMPFVGGCVTQQTLVKCGQRLMPMIGHWTNLSRSGHWPNVAKKWCPLLENLSHCGLWSNVIQIVPPLEDFVTQQTLTKCGPHCAPLWRTLSHSGLQPNVVQNVPLAGELCLTADFDQMWSKHMPHVGGLCHTADFDKMWSKHVPLLDRGLCFAMEFDRIWINNILIIEKVRYQTNQI